MRPRCARAPLRVALTFDKFYPKKLKRRADCVFTRALQLENLPADERANLAQAPRYAALRGQSAASASSRKNNAAYGKF